MMGAANTLALVSLIISVTAFIVAFAQALQQFAASAEGYRRCKEGIMGLWGRRTRRVFTIEEFRFKVIFSVPVLFVASPTNTFGPVKDRPISSVTGLLDSYRRTSCRVPSEQEADAKVANQSSNLSKIQRVHTADDELATWVVLLETLQKAEAEGREWDRTKSSLKTKDFREVHSTLVVQVQEKRRTWDQMPDAVQKPFATSTVCHIVEMTTLLGMTWRAFDQDSWNLRAEGNGFILMSQPVWGLGISVSFAVTGKAKFEEDRVIPCPSIKELAFGSVPTVMPGLTLNFQATTDKLGAEYITRRTLKLLKLDHITIDKYFKRREHIRSVNFEIIAMIGQVFRIRLSNFKRLPNPTPDLWHDSISACKLMTEFMRHLENLLLVSAASSQAEWIQHTWKEILQDVWQDNDADIDINLREAAHSVLESCDGFLKSCGDSAVISVVGAHIKSVLDEVNDVNSFLNSRECDTEEELFDHYFAVIRPWVVNFVGRPETSPRVQSSPAVMDSPAFAPRPSVLAIGREDMRQDIWLTLQFRMCCWWLLHDFEETDTMILPTRLKGSRLPVYIL